MENDCLLGTGFPFIVVKSCGTRALQWLHNIHYNAPNASELYALHACMLSRLCCVWLFVTPIDCSPPGCSVHGILQARILEWVVMPFSRGSSRPKDQTRVSCVSCFGREVFYHLAPPGKPLILHIKMVNMFFTTIFFLNKSESLFSLCFLKEFV